MKNSGMGDMLENLYGRHVRKLQKKHVGLLKTATYQHTKQHRNNSYRSNKTAGILLPKQINVPCLIPFAANSIIPVSPALKMNCWPKFSKDKDMLVFKFASSYSFKTSSYLFTSYSSLLKYCKQNRLKLCTSLIWPENVQGNRQRVCNETEQLVGRLTYYFRWI